MHFIITQLYYKDACSSLAIKKSAFYSLKFHHSHCIIYHEIVFFYQRVIKRILFPRVGQKNPFSDPIVVKNRMALGKNINFTRLVVTLALLGHQTSHSQSKFFSLVAQYTILYYRTIKWILLPRAGQKKPFFEPLCRKKTYATQEKH